jgi:hypothetical protein
MYTILKVNIDKVETPCTGCVVAESDCPNKKRRESFFGLKGHSEVHPNGVRTQNRDKVKKILEEVRKMRRSCRNFQRSQIKQMPIPDEQSSIFRETKSAFKNRKQAEINSGKDFLLGLFNNQELLDCQDLYNKKIRVCLAYLAFKQNYSELDIPEIETFMEANPDEINLSLTMPRPPFTNIKPDELS